MSAACVSPVAEGQKLTVECGMDATNMNWTTTTTLRPTTPPRLRSTTATTPAATSASASQSGPTKGEAQGPVSTSIYTAFDDNFYEFRRCIMP